MAVCAEIYRNDHTWNDHRKILVDYIINSGTDGVWFSDFKAATGADADVRKLIPLGWLMLMSVVNSGLAWAAA